MEMELGVSLRDVEAAEAETARKLAADRAVELESPALRTYVSENPDAEWDDSCPVGDQHYSIILYLTCVDA